MGLGICTTGLHRHEMPARGGRCGFLSPGRPGDICGRESVAAYVREPSGIAWRCSIHDRDVARLEAARQGFTRVEAGS